MGREVTRLELTRQDSRFRPLVLTPGLREGFPKLAGAAIVEGDEAAEGSIAASRAESSSSRSEAAESAISNHF